MEDVGDVVAGGLGGLACVLAGQPLDTIKVKLQTYPHLYISSLDAIRKTLRQERFAGFYAGASPAVLSSVLENAVLFVCYSHCQQLVQLAVGAETQDGMSVVQQASSGALASVFSSVAITPPDRIKCKLQVYQQQNRETVIKRRLVKSILVSNPYHNQTTQTLYSFKYTFHPPPQYYECGSPDHSRGRNHWSVPRSH